MTAYIFQCQPNNNDRPSESLFFFPIFFLFICIPKTLKENKAKMIKLPLAWWNMY